MTLPAAELVPQWQIDEAVKRLSELEKYPERSGDFDAMVNHIEKEYGL